MTASLVGSLDLFVLLVDYIAGNILFSLVLWGIIILVSCIMGRLSTESTLILLATYFSVSLFGYFGAIAVVPLFIIALWWAVTGIINKFSETR